MTDHAQPLRYHRQFSEWTGQSNAPATHDRLEPATCVESEPFALQVLDDSMQPEFGKGCIILIDPTGRATNGSYVLVRLGDSPNSIDSTTTDSTLDSHNEHLGALVFRQLIDHGVEGWGLKALNEDYQSEARQSCELSDIVGVIVQRAGVRRKYHKRYDG